MNPTKSAAPIPKVHRVALVDNDPRALESLSLLIEAKVPTAYVVWTATSGDEAIERCQRNDDNLNLLVLDMSMEGLQGPAICHRIRLMDRHLPILGITSFSINSYRSRLMEAGAQGLIGKEDSDQLAKAIERLCGGNVMEGFEPPALANVRIRREEETSPRLTVREEQIISLCADGMLAYETNNLVALLLLAYSIGDQLFRQLVLGTSRSNPVAIIAMVSLVLMLGCGLRWNQAVAGSRAEAEQAKARLREMESRSHIAEAIHDAVTGDLSAAAFVAQRRIDALSGGDDGDGSASTDGDDGKNADERRDELDKWTQVNDYILSALTNVHRVIDELDMDVTVLEEDADGKAFSDLLKATMAGGDRRLRALGFDITSILHVAGGAPSASPSLAGIANDLLRETYANIARHAQSGSKADLSVILKPNAVEITQINQARTTETDRTQPGGHGLAYFSKQLESHGGKLETTLRDGEWTLFAYLPIPVPETLPPLAGHPES